MKKWWRFLFVSKKSGLTPNLLHVDSLTQVGFLFKHRWHVLSREKMRHCPATWDLFNWCEGEISV